MESSGGRCLVINFVDKVKSGGMAFEIRFPRVVSVTN